jgi:hypothetical protein
MKKAKEHNHHGLLIKMTKAKEHNHHGLKKPCSNCPFRKEGAIHLSEGRLEAIIDHLVKNDYSTFQCHKTVHHKTGGDWDDEGNYLPSGNESMCAGAAAYLMKLGRPTVGMRIAFCTGDARPTDWNDAMAQIIDPDSVS